jgi:predicted nuclease with TOPRIM domain
MELEFLEQLEDKIRESAKERKRLIKDSEELRRKFGEQQDKVKSLSEKVSQAKGTDQEVKQRIDRLIEFLEGLPVMKDGK